MNSINASIWNTDDQAFFPELCKNFVNIRKFNPNGVSIAFSGGAPRAFTAMLGYMKALIDIKIGDKNAVTAGQFLSTVSAGSFFFGTYLFAKGSKYTDSQLLGKPLAPSKITNKSLETRNLKNKNFMGQCILRTPIKNYLLEGQKKGIPNGYLWQYAIGKLFLTRYGLSKKLITLNPYYYDKLKHNNPTLQSAIYPHKFTPFWICNSALNGVKLRHDARIGIQFTPLYAGIPQAVKNLNNNQLIGGYWMDSVAFGAKKPQQNIHPKQCKNQITNVKLSTIESGLLTLDNIMGNSTNAQSYLSKDDVTQIFGKYVNLYPYYSFWSPLTKKYENKTYYTNDGADIDNTGILSLLQRRCKTIIAFDNLTSLATTTRPPHDTFICSLSLSSLFGVPSKESCPSFAYPYNNYIQVFESDKWDPFTDQILTRLNCGGPSYARAKLKVLPNPIQGVEGNYVVDLLVIVLAPSTKFNNLLPSSITDTFTNMNDPFYNFPFLPLKGKTYNTLLQYTLPQVNLLASYAYWSVHNTELKDVIRDMYN